MYQAEREAYERQLQEMKRKQEEEKNLMSAREEQLREQIQLLQARNNPQHITSQSQVPSLSHA